MQTSSHPQSSDGSGIGARPPARTRTRQLIAGLIAAIFIASLPAIAATQGEREVFIQKLIRIGAIKKINYPGGNLPHVWATPYLLNQDYDTKDSILNACWAYAYQGRPNHSDILVIRHSISGKRIGTYSHAGLKLE